jgi:hypothetical protein
MLKQTLSAPSLSRSEWQAVSIALADAQATSCLATAPEGTLRAKLGRLYHTITGNEPRRPLADPRLETLRRFVCATRRLRRVAEEMVPNLIAQGYNRAQIDAIAMLSA